MEHACTNCLSCCKSCSKSYEQFWIFVTKTVSIQTIFWTCCVNRWCGKLELALIQHISSMLCSCWPVHLMHLAIQTNAKSFQNEAANGPLPCQRPHKNTHNLWQCMKTTKGFHQTNLKKKKLKPVIDIWLYSVFSNVCTADIHFNTGVLVVVQRFDFTNVGSWFIFFHFA